MNPLQHAVYKGTGGKYGAVQFNLQPPHFFSGKLKDFTGKIDPDGRDSTAAFTLKEVDGRKKVTLKEGWKQREGAVFVEASSATAKDVYDWKNKIIFAMSVSDLGKAIYFLTTGQSPNSKEQKGSMSIYHDPNAKTTRANTVKKNLKFYSPNGPAQGGILSLEQTEGEEKKSHRIPLSGDDVMVLRKLFEAAVPRALAW
jgi:hypothetical protein